MPGPELDGQVLGEMDDGGLGCRVAVRRVLPQGADADPAHRRGDDDAGRVGHGGPGAEQCLKLLYGVEDALDVEIHDFLEGGVRVGFEALAPGCAGVGEQDVDVRGGFGDGVGKA